VGNDWTSCIAGWQFHTLVGNDWTSCIDKKLSALWLGTGKVTATEAVTGLVFTSFFRRSCLNGCCTHSLAEHSRNFITYFETITIYELVDSSENRCHQQQLSWNGKKSGATKENNSKNCRGQANDHVSMRKGNSTGTSLSILRKKCFCFMLDIPPKV
jgi:hypothetical protein